MLHGLARHARQALLTPESEILGDVWDLTVFGHSGTVSFTGITQPWLREAGKRWAADDLPPPGAVWSADHGRTVGCGITSGR